MLFIVGLIWDHRLISSATPEFSPPPRNFWYRWLSHAFAFSLLLAPVKSVNPEEDERPAFPHQISTKGSSTSFSREYRYLLSAILSRRDDRQRSLARYTSPGSSGASHDRRWTDRSRKGFGIWARCGWCRRPASSPVPPLIPGYPAPARSEWRTASLSFWNESRAILPSPLTQPSSRSLGPAG